jgi:hypothetical protein
MAALAALPVHAQDEARVVSPDGQIEFLLGVAEPKTDHAALPGLAYQIHYRGKPLIDVSYLGFDVLNQEPLLGEKVGLSKAANAKGAGYNSVLAEYLQNGSLGRWIHVEARAYNDGVAFRYVIPPSAPLTEIFLRDEFTEFRFAGDVKAVRQMPADSVLNIPAALETPAGWISIGEAGAKSPMHLRPYEGRLVVRMPRLAEDPRLVLKTRAPWTSAWRVVAIGGSEGAVRRAGIEARLK